jgi:hypothetical protein
MHPAFILQRLVGAVRIQAFVDLGGLCEAVSSGSGVAGRAATISSFRGTGVQSVHAGPRL